MHWLRGRDCRIVRHFICCFLWEFHSEEKGKEHCLNTRPFWLALRPARRELICDNDANLRCAVAKSLPPSAPGDTTIAAEMETANATRRFWEESGGKFVTRNNRKGDGSVKASAESIARSGGGLRIGIVISHFEGRAIRQTNKMCSTAERGNAIGKESSLLHPPPETNAAARNLAREWEGSRIMHGAATACAVMDRCHTRTRRLHLLMRGQVVILWEGGNFRTRGPSWKRFICKWTLATFLIESLLSNLSWLWLPYGYPPTNPHSWHE